MNRNITIGIVLGLLIVISAVQAYQLATIKSKLGGAPTSGSTVKITTTTTPTASSGGGAAPQLPPSLENLPSMVGGC